MVRACRELLLKAVLRGGGGGRREREVEGGGEASRVFSFSVFLSAFEPTFL